MSENCQDAPAQPSSPPRKRGPGRPFKKGQPSPNPGGRPRLYPEVRALAQRHTDEIIETLVFLMQYSEKDEVRRAAACDLWDRAWGRPHQTILAAVGEVPAVDVEGLRAVLAARVAALAAARDVHGSGAHSPDGMTDGQSPALLDAPVVEFAPLSSEPRGRDASDVVDTGGSSAQQAGG